MSKTSKAAARRRKARKARKAQNLASQGKGTVAKSRNLTVLGMLLNCKGGSHGDEKKKQNKSKCRKKVEE